MMQHGDKVQMTFHGHVYIGKFLYYVRTYSGRLLAVCDWKRTDGSIWQEGIFADFVTKGE